MGFFMETYLSFPHAALRRVVNFSGRPTRFHGYVYILELEDRLEKESKLKIGSTCNPKQRLQSLISQFTKYRQCSVGRFLFSEPHTNYRQNEKILINQFDTKRVGATELFYLSLEKFLKDYRKDIPLLDESSQFEEKSKRFVDFVVQVLMQGSSRGR